MRTDDSATAFSPEPLHLDIEALRADTPGAERVIHFNNAGCGLLARPVLSAMQEHLVLESQIGGYEASALRAAEVGAFYTETAALINAGPSNIAFASSATQAFSMALSSVLFERGDVILTTRNDFVSSQIAFLALRKRFGIEVVHAPDLPEGGVDVEAMAQLMREHRPRLVTATHIPTNSGLIQPVAQIGQHCREFDLLYLVDACQSVGQLPIDVAEIGCDFLTSTSRKFLRGPRGSGFLFASSRVLEAGYEPMLPDMHGARWTGQDSYRVADSAARFEEWEFPYATVLGCAEAARYARQTGMTAIAARTSQLAQQLRTGLEGVPGVRLLDRGTSRGALITLTIAGWEEPKAFKEALDAGGVNSALSLREFAVLDFGDKDVDWCLRLSPHYYNTEPEVDSVVAAITELAL